MDLWTMTLLGLILTALGVLAKYGGVFYSRRAALSGEATREATEERCDREKPDLRVTKAHALADTETIFGFSYPPPFFLDVYFTNAGGSTVGVDHLTAKLEGEGEDVNVQLYANRRIPAQTKRRKRIATEDLPASVEPYHVEEVVAVDLKGSQVAASVEGREEARAVSGAKKLRSDVAGDPDGHSHVEAELFEEDDPKGGRRFVVAWREHSHSSVYSHLKRRAKRREAEDLLDDVLEEAGRRLDADENVAEIRRSLDLAS